MKIFLRIVYFLAMTTIILLLIFQLLLKFTSLEFSHERYQEQFDSIFFFGIPVAIEMTLARLGLRNDLNKARIKSTVIVTSLIAAVVFVAFILYSFATFGSGMCTSTTGETLFENRTNKNQRIVKRYFGCGATDSGPAVVSIEKLQDITSLFVYVTDIDTTQLNQADWIRVKAE